MNTCQPVKHIYYVYNFIFLTLDINDHFFLEKKFDFKISQG